mmetsp:Transcript_84098/g.233046  ORF Transcript_84098/g.233046 Transcript_84098/m.233046 type:complete len:200 (-) Transcript_84098:877-1476(-)
MPSTRGPASAGTGAAIMSSPSLRALLKCSCAHAKNLEAPGSFRKVLSCGGSMPGALGAKSISQPQTSKFGLSRSNWMATSSSSGSSSLDRTDSKEGVELDTSLGASPAAAGAPSTWGWAAGAPSTWGSASGAPSTWGCTGYAKPAASPSSKAWAVRMPTKKAKWLSVPSAPGALTALALRSTTRSSTFCLALCAVTSVV